MHHVSAVGGASYCLLNVIKVIDRCVYEPIVLLRDHGPLEEELNKLGVEVFFCPTLTTYPYNKSLLSFRVLYNIFVLFRSIYDFKKTIARCSPDIVYLNNTLLFPYLKSVRKAGIKSIIHIREHWPEGQHQKQFQFVKRQVNENVDRIVAINEFSARMISSDYSKTTIVYDWIVLSERYKPMPLDGILGEKTSNLKIFLYTGGIQSIKGCLEVVRLFTNDMKDSNYRLLAMGIPQALEKKTIKDYIKAILHSMGYLTYSYKVNEIIKSDKRIICVPNTYYITHLLEQVYCNISFFTIPHANLTLAECICMDLPCIAAKTEESLEYSMGGNLALLFDINSEKSFLEAVDKLSYDYDKLKTELKNKSHIIRKKFDKETNVKQLKTVLDSL